MQSNTYLTLSRSRIRNWAANWRPRSTPSSWRISPKRTWPSHNQSTTSWPN